MFFNGGNLAPGCAFSTLFPLQKRETIASKAWITYCDPWMKREFADDAGLLQPGKVYRASAMGVFGRKNR